MVGGYYIQTMTSEIDTEIELLVQDVVSLAEEYRAKVEAGELPDLELELGGRE